MFRLSLKSLFPLVPLQTIIDLITHTEREREREREREHRQTDTHTLVCVCASALCVRVCASLCVCVRARVSHHSVRACAFLSGVPLQESRRFRV